MGFGIDLDKDKTPPAVSVEPTLTYQATNGNEVRLDERAPGAARERALARGLLLHALALIDAADRS